MLWGAFVFVCSGEHFLLLLLTLFYFPCTSRARHGCAYYCAMGGFFIPVLMYTFMVLQGNIIITCIDKWHTTLVNEENKPAVTAAAPLAITISH